ncbi:MAG TPA: hypothetical protein VF045_09075 [Acidimicrobiales bacterium]
MTDDACNCGCSTKPVPEATDDPCACGCSCCEPAAEGDKAPANA